MVTTSLYFNKPFPEEDIQALLSEKGINNRLQGDWLIMKCLSPDHDDNNPSFGIHKEHGGFKCFSCGIQGSWDDLCTMMGWDFSSNQKTVIVDRVPPLIMDDVMNNIKVMKRPQQQLIKFHYPNGYKIVQPSQADCRHFYRYIFRRKIQSAIMEFEIGYTFAMDSQYQRNFWNRIIIPVHDEFGNFVWPEGRILDDLNGPRHPNTSYTKYYRPKNSPKTKHLFNLHRALQIKKKRSYVFVTEGVIDPIQLYIWNYPGVATFGAAISIEQCALLVKYFDKVYLAFDNDKAGREAQSQAIGYLKSCGVGVYRMTMPYKQDFNSITHDRFLYLFKNHVKVAY